MVKNLDHLIIYELTVPKNPGLYSILGDFQNKFIHLTSVQHAASILIIGFQESSMLRALCFCYCSEKILVCESVKPATNWQY